MTLSLTLGPTTLQLSPDLQWSDEYAWSAVTQRTEYSITGALILEAAAKQAGRPITLQGAPQYAWLTRATVEALQAWAAQPGAQMTLLMRGVSRTVTWRHDAPPVEAAPLIDYATPEAGDYYVATLRLIAI